MQLCRVEHFFNILVLNFLYSAITPKSEDKYVVKVFNWSKFHLSEMTVLQNPYFSWISESHSRWLQSPKKGAKSPHKAFSTLIRKSAEGIDLAPFIGNWTKVKISAKIKPPLDDHGE